MMDFNEKRGIHPALKVLRFVGLLVLVAGGVGLLVAQPSCSHYPPTEQRIPAERLRGHVSMLSEKLVPRDHLHTGNLDRCADYIASHFTHYRFYDFDLFEAVDVIASLDRETVLASVAELLDPENWASFVIEP